MQSSTGVNIKRFERIQLSVAYADPKGRLWLLVLHNLHSGLLPWRCAHLVVLVDDGHSQQDTSARADSSHEVSHNGQGSNAHATKRGSCGDVPVELLLQAVGAVTVTL